MSIRQVSHLSARHFPNVGSAGFYSPHSLAVTLQVAAPETDQANPEDWYRNHLPLLLHEYQHGHDHIGTITGRKLLDVLCGYYGTFEQKLRGIQPDLHHWVNLHDLQKRFFRREYFTEVNSNYRVPAGKRPKWQWQLSIGQNFDLYGNLNYADPMMFIRFTDAEVSSLVARQPLTAAALFETRAMACELEWTLKQKAIEFGSNQLKWDAFNKQQISMFYDPDLTIYSAPVHLLATQQRIEDPVLAYRLSAIIAYIALNVTDDLPLNIPPMPEWISYNNTLNNHFKTLIRSRDPGFLYFCLVVLAPEYNGNENAWLDECLKKTGFPSKSIIESYVQSSLQIPSAVNRSQTFDHIYWDACINGVSNFNRLKSSFGLLDSITVQALGTVRGPVALPNTIVDTEVLLPSRGVHPFMPINTQAQMLEVEKIFCEHLSEFLAACR